MKWGAMIFDGKNEILMILTQDETRLSYIQALPICNMVSNE
jgi:hypothetical protein